MKFIFDFDDVLFDNTKKLKEFMYIRLQELGVTRVVAKEYYKEVRAKPFWLKEMIAHFSLPNSFYEEMLEASKDFVNQGMLNILKKLGKENCYILTHGGEEWQSDKIKVTSIDKLVSEVIVISESKKEAVEKICAKHKNEEVIFIDDKPHHFNNLDFRKYPNLKTILFDEKGLEKVTAILPQS